MAQPVHSVPFPTAMPTSSPNISISVTQKVARLQFLVTHVHSRVLIQQHPHSPPERHQQTSMSIVPSVVVSRSRLPSYRHIWICMLRRIWPGMMVASTRHPSTPRQSPVTMTIPHIKTTCLMFQYPGDVVNEMQIGILKGLTRPNRGEPEVLREPWVQMVQNDLG